MKATASSSSRLPARCGLAKHHQRGLGAIAAVMVLLIMSTLTGALLRWGHYTQSDSANQTHLAQANQAARSGLQWGLYQTLRGSWAACSNTTQTLDLSAVTGMRVTVRCDSHRYNEGESTPGTALTVRLYTLDATACNSPTACPDASLSTTPHYVEHRRQLILTD